MSKLYIVGAGALLALSMIGCGGGDDGVDLVGLYSTTSHEESKTGCSGGTTPTDSPAFFRIRESNGAVELATCSSQNEADCSIASGLLFEDIENGLRGGTPAASGSPFACILGYLVNTATINGDTLTFDARTYRDEGEIDPCSLDEAELRAETMECVEYEVLVGTRL